MVVGTALCGIKQHLGIRLMQVGAIFTSALVFPLAARFAFFLWTTAILTVLTDVTLISTARAHKPTVPTASLR